VRSRPHSTALLFEVESGGCGMAAMQPRLIASPGFQRRSRFQAIYHSKGETCGEPSTKEVTLEHRPQVRIS